MRPEATYLELLMRALNATGDPEQFAKTLLTSLVKSRIAADKLREFRRYVTAGPLGLAGGDEPRGSREFSFIAAGRGGAK